MASDILKRRWSTAVVLVILATAGLVGTVASRWTHDILFDTDAWVETVGPVGTDEVVTGALADRASQELIDWVDAENRLEDLLPPLLSPLAGLIAPYVDDAIVTESQEFFESDLYEDLWVEVNEQGHAAAVAVIRDQVPFASTAGGEVTVDLVPLLTPIADRVFDRLTELGDLIPGFIGDQIELDDTIQEIVDVYEEEGLPDRLSNVQIYESDRLAAVQQATAMLDRLIWVLPVLTLIFAAGAIYFAPHRWLMVAILLGAAAVGWLLAWLSVRLVVSSIVGGIDSPDTADVAEAVFVGVTDGLTNLLVALALVAGVSSIAVGWWLNRTETAS